MTQVTSSASYESLTQRDDGRRLCLGYFIALLLAGILYVASVAPGPLWQDSGMAQNRTLDKDLRGTLGLALSHPLYYVFTIAFQYLPFQESAYKTNLVSAVFGAITVANLVLLLRILTGRWIGAVVGGISLAVAHTFWQHGALAEVYTVTTALLTLELLCLERFISTRRMAWLYALFAVNGLGISNHMFAVLTLACYGGLVLYWLYRAEIKPVSLLGLAIFWIAGAGIYLFMILSDILHGSGIAHTLHSALFGNFFSSAIHFIPTKRQLLNSVIYIGLNFPTPVILLAFWGLRPPERLRNFHWIVMAAAALQLIWAIRYDVPDQYTFYIPFIVLLSIFIGQGADRFLQHRKQGWQYAVVAAALLPAMIYISLPWLAAALHLNIGLTRDVPYRDGYRYFLWPWKTGYDGAERFAREVEEKLPPGSVLICERTTVEPIHYLQSTGRWHKDARIFPPPRHSTGPKWPEPDRIKTELAAGKVYVVSPAYMYCPDWLLENYQFEKDGILYRVVGRK